MNAVHFKVEPALKLQPLKIQQSSFQPLPISGNAFPGYCYPGVVLFPAFPCYQYGMPHKGKTVMNAVHFTRLSRQAFLLKLQLMFALVEASIEISTIVFVLVMRIIIKLLSRAKRLRKVMYRCRLYLWRGYARH